MPLNFSASHSSRITKRSQRRPPSLKRSSISLLDDMPRRKSVQRAQSRPEKLNHVPDEEDFFGEPLKDVGLVKSLAKDMSLRDVVQTVQYVQTHMFDAVPESGGFNSVRIAEILTFRKSLPPTVTVAHVHALLSSPTRTEKEIFELTKAGTIRRLITPGRGTGGSSIGEGMTLSRDIERLVGESKELERAVAEKFIAVLRAQPTALSIPSSSFKPLERIALMHAGFMASSSQLQDTTSVFSHPEATSPGTITSIANISKGTSGSHAAVGGEGAVHGAGGRVGIRRSSSQFEQLPEHEPLILDAVEDFRLSLPNMGPYLKLLTAARSHLISLITQSRFKEIPLCLLRERWDGGISAQDSAAKAKKSRGEFAGVLPSRTRKWKQYYGLSFDWVVAECLGAGLLEAFETGSVGRAIRII